MSDDSLPRKFSLPNFMSAASSPVSAHPDVDPIVRDKYENHNPLLDGRFVVNIARVGVANYFVQDVKLPGMSLPAAMRTTPLIDVPVPGDKINFDNLVVYYVLDARLESYLEHQRWMRGMGKPEGHNENDALTRVNPVETSDISVTLVSGTESFEVATWHFQRAWPTFVGGFSLTSTGQGKHIIFPVVYEHAGYTIHTFPEGEPAEVQP